MRETFKGKLYISLQFLFFPKTRSIPNDYRINIHVYSTSDKFLHTVRYEKITTTSCKTRKVTYGSSGLKHEH